MIAPPHQDPPASPSVLEPELAWSLLLTLRTRAKASEPLPDRFGLSLDNQGQIHLVPANDHSTLLEISGGGRWSARASVTPAASEQLDLYLPLALASHTQPLTVAHLGQSLDGYIATLTGASRYVNGPENLTHLHRMRALSDAVVVGSHTVACDNPQLTTRRVVGPNPVRVILDPRRRLDARWALFQDPAAPTLLVCDETRVDSAKWGHADILGVPCVGQRLDLRAVFVRLRARGLFGIFVEGGGLTVSAFLEEKLLDRLQITVAPLIIGSGRRSVTLPPIRDLADGLRPPHRRYPMGEDVLFDCHLRP